MKPSKESQSEAAHVRVWKRGLSQEGVLEGARWTWEFKMH